MFNLLDNINKLSVILLFQGKMNINTCANCSIRYIYSTTRSSSELHKTLCYTCEQAVINHKPPPEPAPRKSSGRKKRTPADYFKVDPPAGQSSTVNDTFEDMITFILSNKPANHDTAPGKPAHKKSRFEPDPADDIILDTEPEDEDSTKPIEFQWIGDDVKDIRDLIRLGQAYSADKPHVRSNLDLYRLSKLVKPLQELDNMIGLQAIKSKMFDQIIFHLQNLDDGNKDMNHTTIKGPPGVGKTKICHIIANIYNALGCLRSNTVISVKLDDLVAGYLGQTAIKTRKKLEEALGGVLLIDEAYSFGDAEGKDTFKKDAVDMLTSFLSEHGHEFICIIAGYKDALDKQFFNMNTGLARRFSIHYEIEPYTPVDMGLIFRNISQQGGWTCPGSSPNTFIQENMPLFPNFGGDCLSLFAYCKKAHARRLLTIKTYDELQKSKKILTLDDITAGFELYKAGTAYNASIKAKADQLASTNHIYI